MSPNGPVAEPTPPVPLATMILWINSLIQKLNALRVEIVQTQNQPMTEERRIWARDIAVKIGGMDVI